MSLFTNLADNILMPGYAEFASGSAAFAAEAGPLASYCSNLGTPDESAALSAAQAAWADLMTQFQATEMFQIGPVTDRSGFYRVLVHSYGATSGVDTCLVDRNVVRAQGTDFNLNDATVSGPNTRGLTAIEYLLHTPGLDATCATSNDQTVAWAAFSDAEKKSARCDYAQLIARDIASIGEEVHQAWLPAGGNYRNTFINADAQTTLQSITDALFYFEKITKDTKLGIALGIKKLGVLPTDRCDALACPERVESPFSNHSLNNIKANLETFWQLYTGLDGEGFDDIIAAANMSSINQAFATDVNSALSLIDEMIIQGDSVLEQAQAIVSSGSHTACANSNANPDSVKTVTGCSLHGLLKRISDRLRTDFITLVNVKLPDSASGDAD